MRVLHVYRTYFPDSQGGLEEVIRQICRNTGLQGVESRVFTLSANPSSTLLQREEAEVCQSKLTFEVASCGVSVRALACFRQQVEWADIIHYHFPWPFADLLHLVARVNKPSLVTYHSDIVRQKGLLKLYRPLMHAFLRRVDSIVATSQNYFATSSILGFYSEKVEVIPIGLDETTYPVPEESFVDKLRGRVGEGFFLFVGVLRYYKGLHILLEAIKDSDLKVVIVGSGPVEKELKKRAADLNLKNVQFLGYVSDEEKVALIHLSRAIVFPSYLRSEAFGVTLVEGAMYGKPLISTEIGTGTSFVNEDGVTGFVVPPASPKHLQAAMFELENDSSLAVRMGEASRSRYERLFTGKLMGERYARLYEKLL
ncbi:MAG: glycosyltransferase [Candidatus Polarisedimenticolaceae bacterium]|nr:glycosyltransferase [Candidatus Polarisedimenticolaceae bacterium]